MHNAKKCGVDIAAVDTVIISHGHVDHGGGLGAFLQMNHTAKVYIRPDAFLPHYNKVLRIPVYCGLDSKYKDHRQIVLTGERHIIDKNLILVCRRRWTQMYAHFQQLAAGTAGTAKGGGHIYPRTKFNYSGRR